MPIAQAKAAVWVQVKALWEDIILSQVQALAVWAEEVWVEVWVAIIFLPMEIIREAWGKA